MHAEDAAVVRGEARPPPVKPGPGLFNAIMARLLMPVGPLVFDVEPVEIEYEIQDGDVLDFVHGLRAIHVPGHSAGQLAFMWPNYGGVLFAADEASNIFGLG